MTRREQRTLAVVLAVLLALLTWANRHKLASVEPLPDLPAAVPVDDEDVY